MVLFAALSREIEPLGQVLRLAEACREFDADDDGQITIAELGGILRSLGCTVSDQDVDVMRHGDTNRDGLLIMDEFLEMNTKDIAIGSGLVSILDATIEAFGPNCLEVMITREELHEVMGNLGMNSLSIEDCKAMIASMDGDGDGAVPIEDFRLSVDSFFYALFDSMQVNTK